MVLNLNISQRLCAKFMVISLWHCWEGVEPLKRRWGLMEIRDITRDMTLKRILGLQPLLFLFLILFLPLSLSDLLWDSQHATFGMFDAVLQVY
jgi:hypothetical protein